MPSNFQLCIHLKQNLHDLGSNPPWLGFKPSMTWVQNLHDLGSKPPWLGFNTRELPLRLDSPPSQLLLQPGTSSRTQRHARKRCQAWWLKGTMCWLQKHSTSTPWKINMEPENHLFEKGNHLNQTFIFGFQPLIFRGEAFITILSAGKLEMTSRLRPSTFHRIKRVASNQSASFVRFHYLRYHVNIVHSFSVWQYDIFTILILS